MRTCHMDENIILVLCCPYPHWIRLPLYCNCCCSHYGNNETSLYDIDPHLWMSTMWKWTRTCLDFAEVFSSLSLFRDVFRTHPHVWVVSLFMLVLELGAEMSRLASELRYDREIIRIWFCNKRQVQKNTVRQLSRT